MSKHRAGDGRRAWQKKRAALIANPRPRPEHTSTDVTGLAGTFIARQPDLTPGCCGFVIQVGEAVTRDPRGKTTEYGNGIIHARCAARLFAAGFITEHADPAAARLIAYREWDARGEHVPGKNNASCCYRCGEEITYTRGRAGSERYGVTVSAGGRAYCPAAKAVSA